MLAKRFLKVKDVKRVGAEDCITTDLDNIVLTFSVSKTPFF